MLEPAASPSGSCKSGFWELLEDCVCETKCLTVGQIREPYDPGISLIKPILIIFQGLPVLAHGHL